MVPKRYDTWCPDIINSSAIPDIPEIPIFIKISPWLWFRKGMTLDICPNISEILNMPKILNIIEILTIPEITITI